ncbi:MAG: hypothetical protein ACREXS_06965 [Gammaproteobacteria bacterium]
MNKLALDTREEAMVHPSADCPTPGMVLDARDELVFPKHKRVVTQYATDASGVSELHLHYGDKEIVFDEPALFPFGESLTKQERFVAGSATEWDSSYDWPRVRALLEQLLEEGILKRAQHHEQESNAPRGACPSPLPAAPSTVARTWFDCEAIMRELTGRPLELGYLELVVPIYRVAHMSLDAEGRQVGEANVFPEHLRLAVPTEWRACPHAGSRYQDPQPMNVTALKSMRKYWSQMMVALAHIRETYIGRFPRARHGWTVGDLQRLSALVLTLPAYLLMRSEQRVENGDVHPVLSSMFRVTDGVRMVMHQMLYSSLYEPTLAPEAPMTSAEIYAYAERNYLFHSAYGVCAGPKPMIEQFLSVLVDGEPSEDAASVVLESPVQAALDDLDAAFDYCLYGLQAYAVVFSLWPAMGKAYEQLLTIVEAWSGDGSPMVTGLREVLQSSVQYLQTSTRLNAAEWSVNRDRGYADRYALKLQRVYGDMYAQCADGLGPERSGATLATAIAPVWLAQHAEATEHLRTLLGQRCGLTVSGDEIERLVAVLMDYFRQEQAIVRAASEIQRRIARLLGRSAPRRPLAAPDLHLYYQLQDVARRQPYLVADLEEALGLHIVVSSETIEIAARGYGHPSRA